MNPDQKKPKAVPYFLWILAAFFTGAGAMHFIRPEPYMAMMPPWLPWHGELIWLSGIAEVLGGLGLIPAKTRRLSGLGLIALLLAVFPANLQVALHGWPGVALPAWVLWLRLPFQGVFIWWVWHAAVIRRNRDPQ